jgi:hypothetical protein
MEKPMPRNDPHPPTLARVLPFALAAAVLLVSGPLARADSGGFTAFAGSFRGAGEVMINDGHRERIACRATGAVGGGGRTLSQNIVCASDSYKFDIRGQLVASGSDVTGDWQETMRGVSGDVRGRIADDRFNGIVNGGGFTANFSLHAAGRRLGFSMRPSDSSVVRVDVTMSR